MRIAVSGKMRAGKDAFAEILIKDYRFKDFRFSAGIKEVIDTYFSNIDDNHKLREYYQTIGQSMRALEQNVWVNYTKQEMNRYLLQNMDRDSNIIVTDLRQLNEYEFLKRNGFIIVKINADEDVRIERAMKAGDVFHRDTLRHETELSVDRIKADYTLTNNWSLKDFRYQVEKLMIQIALNEIEENSTVEQFLS